MKTVTKFFPLAFLVITLVLGAFLLWDWLGGEDGGELACGKLTETRLISATVSFDSHNEGLIYIGDLVEFSVKVIYNHDRVEIKERSLQNFNISPYKRISQSGVETREHSQCSEKTISFTIQALDVSPGSKNRFEYTDSDDMKRQPLVEYVKDGILRSTVPTYEAPLVAPLTDGKVHRIPNKAKLYPVDHGSKRNISWIDIARFSTGLVIILILIAWIVSPYALAKWRGESSQDVSRPLLLGDLFPELSGTDKSHERLTCAYFRTEKLLKFLEAGSFRDDIGELFKERISIVFSEEFNEEQGSEILLRIRSLIEENWDEVFVVYEKIGEAWS